MTITSDWHIHSRNSCDDACLPIATLVRRAAELGITDYGVSDHIHTPFNLPDIAASRKEYLENQPGPRFHFGIEASCVRNLTAGISPTPGLTISGKCRNPCTTSSPQL